MPLRWINPDNYELFVIIPITPLPVLVNLPLRKTNELYIVILQPVGCFFSKGLPG